MKKYAVVTLVALSTLGLGSCSRFMECCFDDPCNPCEMFQDNCGQKNSCETQSKKVEKSCSPCSPKEKSCTPCAPKEKFCNPCSSSNSEKTGCNYTPKCNPCKKPCETKQKKGFSFFKRNKCNNESKSVESSSPQEAQEVTAPATSGGKCTSGCGN